MIKKIKNLFNKFLEYLLYESWVICILDNKTNYNYYHLHLLYVDKKKEYIHVLINLNIFFHALLSFLIFYILYKLNIQIIPEEYLYYCEYLIYVFFFYAFIFWIIIQIFFGVYYLIKEDYKNTLYLGISKLVTLLTIISNIFIVMYIFNIDLNLFLQYNILFVIDCAIILISNIYCKLFNYNIIITRLVNFVYYPWIYMIICFMLLLFTKNLRHDVVYFISETLCFLDHVWLQELENK